MKNKKILIISLIGIILIIAITVGIFIVNKNELKPEDTLNNYISLINEKKYEEMYELISESSKSKISLDDFIKRNKKIYEGIDAYDLKIELKDKNKEDNAYRISYNETMSTSAGIVTFSNEMKLLNENKTYKIDWSSKLIFLN